MRRLVVTVALLVACRGEAQERTDDERELVATPVFAPTCPSGTVANGPACVPRFDACPERTLPRLGGGCTAIGIPDGGCGEGFVQAANGECSPVLPKTTCSEGEIAVPGDAACRPIAACGDGTWGNVPRDASTVHVDASYSAGASDGTASRPFVRIADAIEKASSGATIAVAAGTYVEDLRIDRPLRLYGRCPAKVTVRGSAGDPERYIVTASAAVEIRGIAVTGPGRGAISGTADLTVADVWLHDLEGRGVSFFPPLGKGKLTLRNARIERTNVAAIVGRATLDVEGVAVSDVNDFGLQVSASATEPGTLELRRATFARVNGVAIDVISAKATVDRVHVREVLAANGAGLISEAKSATKELPAEVLLRRSVFERNAAASLHAYGGALVAERVVVRDGVVGGAPSASARVFPPDTTKLEIVDSIFARLPTTAIQNGGSSVWLKRTIVRDVTADVALVGLPSGGEPVFALSDVAVVRTKGPGVAIGSGSIGVERARFAQNGEIALSLESSRGTVVDAVVEDVKARGDRALGLLATRLVLEGEAPRGASSLRLERSVVAGCRSAAIAAFSSEVDLRDVAISKVASAGGFAGVGLFADMHTGAAEPSTVRLLRSSIAETSGAGLVLFGATTQIDGLLVRSVLPIADRYGDAIVASAAERSIGSAVVRNALLEGNARAGISVFGTKLALGSSLLRCNPIPLDAESFFGLSRTPAPVELKDEGGNACGCERVERCIARSSGLDPLPVKR